jgi:hypothetical protein
MAFVYLWNYRPTGHYYIGSHWGHPDDGYICSSRLIKEHIAVNTAEWYREILATGSKESVRKIEQEIIEGVIDDPLCLNQTVGSNRPVLFKDFVANKIYAVSPAVAHILDLLKNN